MILKEFLDYLKDNPQKDLIFEYSPNCFVGANYHITEVKQVDIRSVDCGGKEDQWQETVIQLWESPTELNKTDYMKVDKALSILEVVNKKQALRYENVVKFEYSNAHFHTATLHVVDLRTDEHRVIVKLQIEDTRCKALDVCCPPIEKGGINEAKEACSPGSGCC
ncbi:DUF6428 family protein [Flavobacteriaceae bacterium F08102]|nr:DUF6428 family protein [Flavobacteriaceae bacterium F08102]